MSPRRSVAATRDTRATILERAVDLASTDGLEGLTIGRLATVVGMSKSGLLGHFGDKESLQLAVLEEAARRFRGEVWDKAEKNLQAICDAWISYLEREVFPGGCFFTAAAVEFDDRAGPVRTAVVEYNESWQRILRAEVRRALPAADADQVVFELMGLMLALNQALRLYRDPTAIGRTRTAMARLFRAESGTSQRAESGRNQQKPG